MSKRSTLWKKVSPKTRRTLRIIAWFGGTFGVMLLFLGLLVLINYGTARTVYAESIAAKQEFERAQTAIHFQDFDHATQALDSAESHFTSAHDALQSLHLLSLLPGIDVQLQTADNLLLAGINLSSGAATLTALAVKMNDVISEKEGDVTFGDISAEDKAELLKTLQESSPDLQAVKAEIALAVLLIEDIPEHGLLKPVKNAIAPLQQQLPLLEAVIDQVIPAAQSLPSIAGYPTEKTYLFLLQNNRELRPTGGFIGTYGILKVHNGEMTSFHTDNVYNLDAPLEGTITEPAPGPIAANTGTKQWFLRDINWSPDFPTTAQKAEEKYIEEGGAEQQIDGLIAVTPTFIESLLRLTGPITVKGIEFTDKNFFEKLEHQVEFAYAQQGIMDADRKDIIGELSTLLMERLFALPKSQFSKFWTTFVENVDEKQILIYVDDPLTQSLVIEENWAGEMKPYEGDFLMVVDANLAALKTDEKMERALSYTLSEKDGKFVGTAEMTYNNTTQNITKLYTRYRTYTRIYLPHGATLIEHSGFMTTDKIHRGRPATPEVFEEQFTRPDGSRVSYTVVGGFISIEPRSTGTLRLVYILPDSLQQQIADGEYELYVQKQAGTIDHGLSVKVDVGRRIREALPFDVLQETGDNNVSFETDLQTDREFHVELK